MLSTITKAYLQLFACKHQNPASSSERLTYLQLLPNNFYVVVFCQDTHRCLVWTRQSGGSSRSRFRPSWSRRCPLGCTSPGQNRRCRAGGLPGDMTSGSQHHPQPGIKNKKMMRPYENSKDKYYILCVTRLYVKML